MAKYFSVHIPFSVFLVMPTNFFSRISKQVKEPIFLGEIVIAAGPQEAHYELCCL